MNQNNSSPMFIYAPFRSGGTYVWDKLRKSPGCLGYYEPFNEILGKYNRAEYEKKYESIKDKMRHSGVSKPYFSEFPVDSDGSILNYKNSFAVDNYCMSAEEANHEMGVYLDGLISDSDLRSVIKFCRSPFRIEWLTKHYNPTNVYVIRNPRAQWQSYMSFEPGYFNAMGFVLSAHHAEDPRIAPLAAALGIPLYKASDIDQIVLCYQLLARHYDPARLYFIAYYFWMISLMEVLPHTHIMVDVDLLSESDDRRNALASELEEYGIVTDLSDCSIKHYDEYTLSETTMKSIEDYTHGILKQGFPEKCDKLSETLKKFNHSLSNSTLDHINDLLSTSATNVEDLPSPFTKTKQADFSQAFQGMVDEMNHDRQTLIEEFDKHSSEYKLRMEHCQTYAQSLEERILQLEKELKKTTLSKVMDKLRLTRITRK